MTGGYIAGSSWLHRFPAGWKIALLASLTTLTFYLQSLYLCLAILIFIFVAHYSIGSSFWRRLRSFGSMWIIFVFIGMFQAAASSPANAFLILSQMISVLLFADLLSGTTSPLAMIDAFLWILRPLEKVGFPLHAVSLALMLVLRFVPAQLHDWARRQEAWRARGANRGSWILIPAWIADILKNSDRVAEALDARGFNSHGKSDHAKS